MSRERGETTTGGPAATPVPPLSAAYRWYALGLLAFINLLNYLDRNVIFALFEPIKRDLVLTDTQLGWLGSAYILVFSLAALPFGLLSDLRSRRGVIAWGVAVWSAFTVLGGLVRTFAQLFVCRAAVGIGEAAYGPAASSLVADYFPGKGRAVAMGVLSSGLAFGGVLGILLGGVLEQAYGWRVAFLVVGVPGFAAAVLAARLVDPTRPPGQLHLRTYLRGLEGGLRALVRQCFPLIAGTVVGVAAAFVLERVYGAEATVDLAALGAAVGIGLAANIVWWMRQVRAGRIDRTPFGGRMGGAFGELLAAGQRVLRTPTLLFVFPAGAMISFGMNGLVGWGPTFISRELGLSAGDAALILGKWGLVFGTLGTLAGGTIADWLRRRTPRGRVLTVTAGFLLGGPLAVWLLTVRELEVFVPGFCAAFFFLSWYNGPQAAVIFDVVPARVGATVAGAYLLFIHLAGDAIALPLVGWLSDRFGLDLAVLLLPVVAMVGGILMLGAARTVAADMRRAGMDG
ncbi:MAG TPA: MFS transporter [Gemmatimonadales bacterium]|nr:MFS transporter [Gemmatimonadales bacterium]